MDTSLTDSMAHALNSFITLKLSEYGWLSTTHDDEALRDAITSSLLSPYSRESQGSGLAILGKEETQTGLAEMISTNFLGLNISPTDRDLVSFTECVVDFFHCICYNHFVKSLRSSNIMSRLVGNNSMPSQNSPVIQQTRTFPIFILPPELRLVVYKEILVVPNGGLVRSFAPPPFLQANKRLRDEALPMFYAENHFEITIKRSPKDQALAATKPDGWMPSLDNWVWHRFLHMWDTFNGNGSNCLQFVKHITLIYQLCMTSGWPFGEDEFDKRVGFRFSSDPFEEDLDSDYEEGSDSDASEFDLGLDLDELQAEANILQTEDPDEDLPEWEDSIGDEDDGDGQIEKIPAEDFDPVGVFELDRGTFDYMSRTQTHYFLFRRMMEHGADHLWDIYPIKRFTHMLWCSARDCPNASTNVDFLCEDIHYWTHGNDPYEGYDADGFYDPDGEDMDEDEEVAS